MQGTGADSQPSGAPWRWHIASVRNLAPLVRLLRGVQGPGVAKRRLAIVPPHGYKEPIRDQAQRVRIPGARSCTLDEYSARQGQIDGGGVRRGRACKDTISLGVPDTISLGVPQSHTPVPPGSLGVCEVKHMQVFSGQSCRPYTTLQMHAFAQVGPAASTPPALSLLHPRPAQAQDALRSSMGGRTSDSDLNHHHIAHCCCGMCCAR